VHYCDFVKSLKFFSEDPGIANIYCNHYVHKHDNVHNDRERFVNNVPVVEELMNCIPHGNSSLQHCFLLNGGQHLGYGMGGYV